MGLFSDDDSDFTGSPNDDLANDTPWWEIYSSAPNKMDLPEWPSFHELVREAAQQAWLIAASEIATLESMWRRKGTDI